MDFSQNKLEKTNKLDVCLFFLATWKTKIIESLPNHDMPSMICEKMEADKSNLATYCCKTLLALITVIAVLVEVHRPCISTDLLYIPCLVL